MSTTEPTSRVTEAEIEVAGLPVHVNLSGQGRQCAVLLIHGSGPGATALSNWRFALPALG
jgi:2-hydroxymuconate-semialdehyde hydrolase